ncbi:hypothetical protein L7F22_033067 [Adiantum nelumboides]|nr:hypothetical protein [Adiantum nelumboides]
MSSVACRIEQVKVGKDQEVLQLRELPLEEALPSRARTGFVIVRVTLRPMQPIDLFLIRYGHPLPHLNLPFPHVIGCEGFGIIHQHVIFHCKLCTGGRRCDTVQCGQRVVLLVWLEYHQHGQGSWQDFVELEEEQVIAVPLSVSDEAAAQFFLNPWTAYGLLDDQAVPMGEYLLQTAASSSVGRSVIQIAKHYGIKTINIVRKDAWKEELKALGADEVINSETEDVVERVKDITGGKLAYAAVDAVGGSLTKTIAAAVKDRGRVLVYGVFSGWDVTVSTTELMRGVQVSWWWLFPDYVLTRAKRAEVAKEVMKLLAHNIITPCTSEKFPLKDFIAAISKSEKPSGFEKVLLVT